MKILFFGDVIGKLGRRALAKALPSYKQKYKPDLIIANAENLAHGAGVTISTVEEIIAMGVNILTGGNDMFNKGEYEEVFLQFKDNLIRPANYPEAVPGQGYITLKIRQHRICIINLNGRVFFNEHLDDPFKKFDEIYQLLKIKTNDIVLVDFHAEATSEKSALGWYIDGRANALVGTHTHIPTSDMKILPQGTAFVTDVGMVGARDSIIGVEKEGPLKMFLTQLPARFERPENGLAQIGAILLEIDEVSLRMIKIERVDREVLIN